MATAPITRFQPEIPLLVAPEAAARASWLNDRARLLGIHLMGNAGSGKSRLAGRLPCLFDFLRGTPQVILDPTGATIDNFLDRIVCLPPEQQAKLWPRIQYTDLYATDYINPLPLYYRLDANEPLATTASRFLDVIRATDAALQKAGVEGMNPLVALGTATGMLAAALNLQITAVMDFIHHPEVWLPRLTAAFAGRTELALALDEFRSFEKLSAEGRRRRSGSLLTKLTPLLFDPVLTALLASARPGITMAEVDQGCLTWLIDGRNLPAAHKQEILLWPLRYVTDYLNHRQVTGRHRPISFAIDELTQFLGFSAEQNEAMAAIFEGLISVTGRNYGCNLLIMHQSLAQISSERIRAALMSMGNQVIGRISAPQDRLYIADHFLQYDVYRVKKHVPTYFNMAEPEFFWMGQQAQMVMRPNPQVIDYTTEEYSIDEQRLLLAERFRSLPPFSFLVRAATAEGAVANDLYEMTIEPIDRGRYPDEGIIADVRRQLRERDGYPISQLLAEIEQARQEALTVRPTIASNEDAILKGDGSHVQVPHPLPTRKRSKPQRKAKDGETASTNSDAWQEDLWQKPESP